MAHVPTPLLVTVADPASMPIVLAFVLSPASDRVVSPPVTVSSRNVPAPATVPESL